MQKIISRLVTGGLLAAGAAFANPIQDLKSRVEQPTEVMVLGTQHLKRIKEITPAHLDELHASLMRYRPQAIVVETIASHHIELMLQRPGDYVEVLDQFVGRVFLDLADANQKGLGMTAERTRQQLSECEPLPLDDAERLSRCMRLAAAGYDKAWFDYMAWQYGRRHAKHPLPGTLGEAVKRIAGQVNQNQWIAARLADALGLSRIHAVDDQDSKEVYGPIYAVLEPNLGTSRAVADFRKEARMVRVTDEVEAKALRGGDLLPLYRLLNSPRHDDWVVNEEWRLFVDRDLPRKPALSRLAMWDMRNLHMTSNILRVVARHPGERVLVTVGASHKVFLDDYLNRSIGIKLRQLEEFVAE